MNQISNNKIFFWCQQAVSCSNVYTGSNSYISEYDLKEMKTARCENDESTIMEKWQNVL